MTEPIVTVFGGTGFLGREIVRQLADKGWWVRVAARHPDKAGPPPAGAQRESVRADIRDPKSVAKAVDGADAVVNAVSLYAEGRGLDFQAIHVRGAAVLAREARLAGVARLVHISGIGVDAASPSRYVRARTWGEDAVRDDFEQATILRPSVLFGPGDDFLATLDKVTLLPIVPLFGRGETRLQPVHVDDVARAVVAALRRPDTAGQTFELGGARVCRYREVVEQVLAHRGRKRPLLPFPMPLWKLGAGMLSILPNPPLTADQVILMETDNLASPDHPGFTDLGIEPVGIREVLAECLPRSGRG